MLENEDYLKIVTYLLGLGGFLFGVIGGLVVYIFREHVKDNHMHFSENSKEHNRIYDKIDMKQDKKK